ncbi:Nucleolar complex protein 2 like protein [Atta colombica]|uniref:Nucleolar complex protein 2 like protein n=1 Tax=Atta colombica TaxID=520822 RepID=A0A195BX33_9HYME|nr:PREDICTED: nucleolar complex protein 2 homolog [Atta colombica]KYM93137.1 Nucleolar complex protein 2 like protein [Atta colombica]
MKMKKVSQKPLNLRKDKQSVIAKRKKQNLSKLTTEEFFEQNFETDSDISDDGEENKNIDNENTEQMDSDNSEDNLDPTEHKKSLIKLKDTDPEFYKYLKENDKNLLDFKVSDDEDDDNSSMNSNRHIPNENLVVASDDSDFQPEETEGDSKKKITKQLLKNWQQEIQTDKSITTIKCAVEAFHAALDSVVVVPDKTTEYKVEGSAIFNGVIQLCIMYLPDAFKCFLKLDQESQEAHKSKRFGKIRWILKLYLSDLIKLLQSVASPSILTVLLKHLRQMLLYTRSFSSLIKPLLRILIKFWSSAEETIRVTAFLNILHIATHTINKESVIEKLLKTMYVKYVQNTKFVSPNTLPGINFMKHSLVEIYLLDHDVSYNHAFLYIRQLAINLRNAITLKKQENFQAVYNWQYINSLRFWTELIIKSKEKSMLRSLLYPLVQIIIGTIKVIPTAQYYPLRFHCIEMLIIISKKTGTFIPILPFLLEILDSYDFNKRHKTVTMKPIPLICILRMSKSQLVENGFKDSIIETVYRFILENAANDSYKIYFPDVYIPCIIQLKAFLKKCHVAAYCKKIKQLLNMIEENRKCIEAERIKITIDLKNTAEITNWENKMKTDGTEISKFYTSWIEIHKSQMLKLLTKNEEVLNVSIKTLKKQKLDEQNAEDSEEESEFELRLKGTESEAETKKSLNKMKKHKKNKKQKIANNIEDENLLKEDTDIVQDININDWD